MPSELAIEYQRKLVLHKLTQIENAVDASIYDLRNVEDDSAQVTALQAIKDAVTPVLAYYTSVLEGVNLALDHNSNPDLSEEEIVIPYPEGLGEQR